ncbi:MAG: HNH endonuclease domain-containing protein [Acetobacteraceae bacterium]|nr:HNH endonuclease domain-containing protein [Acetobacteraceae bacterium]
MTQIDHIFPVSRSFDDSQANKVLVFAQENAAKGKRTPAEWLSADEDRWAHLTNVVWPKMVEAGWPDAKRRRCLKARLEDPEKDEAAFTNRQLVDTAYIARAARDYLGLLFGGGQAGLNAVQPVPGRATALLRRAWGVGLGKLLGLGDEADKVRNDLRHHAVDALVVALTEPGSVQALSRWWQLRELGLPRPDFRPPWPAFREEAKAKVERILVSHRVQAKLSGPLHEETRLGDTGQREPDGSVIYVKRKPVAELTASEIRGDRDVWIADEGVRKAILDHLARHGLVLARRERGAAKDASAERALKRLLAMEIRLPLSEEAKRRWAERGIDAQAGPVIKRVRLHLRRKDGVMPVHRRKNMHAELGPGTNHHIAIYRDGEDVRYLVVTKREAYERVRRGEPAVLPEHPEGGRLVMALHPGDVLRRAVGEREEFVVVRYAYGAGPVFFKPHWLAGVPKPQVSKTASDLGSRGLAQGCGRPHRPLAVREMTRTVVVSSPARLSLRHRQLVVARQDGSSPHGPAGRPRPPPRRGAAGDLHPRPARGTDGGEGCPRRLWGGPHAVRRPSPLCRQRACRRTAARSARLPAPAGETAVAGDRFGQAAPPSRPAAARRRLRPRARRHGAARAVWRPGQTWRPKERNATGPPCSGRSSGETGPGPD